MIYIQCQFFCGSGLALVPRFVTSAHSAPWSSIFVSGVAHFPVASSMIPILPSLIEAALAKIVCVFMAEVGPRFVSQRLQYASAYGHMTRGDVQQVCMTEVEPLAAA